MNSWKVILAAVVIFGTGVLTGGLLIHCAHCKSPGNAEPPAAGASVRPSADNRGPGVKPEIPLPKLAERLSKDFVSRLDVALHLSPAQREVIAKIVADGQERNHALWTNVAPEMRKVMQDVRQQIRAELTPEQLKQFEELMKQHPPRRAPGTNAPPGVSAPTHPPAPGD